MTKRLVNFYNSIVSRRLSNVRMNGGAALRCLALVCVLVPAAMAHGAPLGVGGTIFPAAGEPDPTGGLVVAGPLNSPFVTANFSGVLTSFVIAGDPSNTLGGLTFTYRVCNDAASSNVIARLTVNGYSLFATDASYQAPPAGVQPGYIDRQTADVVGFTFASFPIGVGAIAPGQCSTLNVVQTNAPTFANSFASVIDGTVATVPTYAPAPEPTTLVLMGLSGLALIRRRRS